MRWSDNRCKYVGICKALSLKSRMKVWVAWDLSDSSGEKINHGSRTAGEIIVGRKMH